MAECNIDNKQVVLLVSDDPEYLQGIRIILEKGDYHVLTASKGKESLKSFMNNQPDMILADCYDIELDGEGLLEDIRKTPEGKNIPLIFFFSIWTQEKIIFAESLGAHCLFSPFRPSHLLDLVQSYLKGSDELDL